MKKTMILDKLLSCAKKDHLLDYHGEFPTIPKISMQSANVCAEIFRLLQNEKLNNAQFLTISTAWCALAGMGAVAKWNDNRKSLKQKGIIKSLTTERGILSLAEYVMNYIGIGWDTTECRNIYNTLIAYGKDFMLECIEKNEENEVVLNLNSYFEYLQAYYLFGMVYEMSRLGM